MGVFIEIFLSRYDFVNNLLRELTSLFFQKLEKIKKGNPRLLR